MLRKPGSFFGSTPTPGAAFLYLQEGAGWSFHSKLTASDVQDYDAFGGQFALGDDIAMVNAPGHEHVPNQFGAVYVLELTGCDCNQNGVCDRVDIANGTSLDTDGNGVPDECGPYCNSNGIADSCDIASGVVADCNNNGIPDICEGFAPSPASSPSSHEVRYLGLIPANPARSTGLRVGLSALQRPNPPNLPQFPQRDYSALEGQIRWVGPVSDCVETEMPPATFKCATLQCDPYLH
ncbi:MAG: FG-GAP repeat protein [Planctomycetes bacterium]|nr:FG-GAP repeat protein [Planctomycetota bacterium]